MKINKEGLALVKKYEGCYLKAYRCPAGVWTIGYGHTGKVGNKTIKSGMVITQEQADELLKKDMEKFEKVVSKYQDTYKFTNNEFSALVSFSFNVGNIDQLTAKGTRDKKTIAEKMLLYNKASGRVLQGLVNRRKAERKLFLKK